METVFVNIKGIGKVTAKSSISSVREFIGLFVDAMIEPTRMHAHAIPKELTLQVKDNARDQYRTA
jgi:hypothetical protein